MKRWQLIKVVGASLMMAAAGGCVGGIDQGPGPGDGSDDPPAGESADAMFTALQAQLNAECGACHAGPDLNDTATGPDFLGPVGASAGDAIAVLLSYQSTAGGGPIVGTTPENSKLYFYGLHAGPALSAGLAADLSAWILAEETENPKGGGGGGGGEPVEPDPAEPTSLLEALEMFGNCMTYEDFAATNMQNVANQNSAEGQCYACHDDGLGGAYLARNDIEFFSNQREMPYVLKFVTGTVNSDGSFRDLVMSRRYELKRNDNGHPNYIMANERLQSIETFYQLTYQRYRTAIDTNTPCIPDSPL
jgi:hypothetical protein